MLDRFGVDTIEISPIISKEHEEVCKELIHAGLKADIMTHGRALIKDVNAALRCDAKWMAVFLSVSDVHLKSKLKINRQGAIDRIVRTVDYAKKHGMNVRFSAEDASRANPSFLKEICRAAEDAGVDRISITDTVGILFPQDMYDLVKRVRKTVKVPLDVHCHNDLGLALANSLAGVRAGADQIHASVNGIGERVGIPTLAEVSLTLTLQGMKKNLRLEILTELSQLVSSYTGIPVPDFTPIVGKNAFRHKSGTHIAAVLANPSTYEPFPPRLVGNRRRIMFGRYSGAAATTFMLNLFGLSVSEKEARKVVQRIKDKWRDLEFEVVL
jgi:2-isopropylmalate synthase